MRYKAFKTAFFIRMISLLAKKMGRLLRMRAIIKKFVA